MTEAQKTDRIMAHFGRSVKRNKHARVQPQNVDYPTVNLPPLLRLVTPILGLIGHFLTILDLLHWLKTCKDAYDLPRRWRQLCKNGMPIIAEESWRPDHYLPEEVASQIIQRNCIIPKHLAFIVLRTFEYHAYNLPLFIYRHVLHYRDVYYVETGLYESAHPTLGLALGFEADGLDWEGERHASANLFDPDITPKTIKQCLRMLMDGGNKIPLEPRELCDCIVACFDLQPLHAHLLLPLFQTIFDNTYAKGHWPGWQLSGTKFLIDLPLFMFIQSQRYENSTRIYRDVLARQCVELPVDKLRPFLELFFKVFWHPLSEHDIIFGFGDIKRLYQNTEQYTFSRIKELCETVFDLLPATCAREVMKKLSIPNALLDKLFDPQEEPQHQVFKDLYEMFRVD